ncbi:MAG: class 1 isoprenoid biosynthesis enzyme, partial [Methanothrix sp.]|nr:class 1 isoprenoid biosynthesis enzyme [Methanothrix sp.]
MKVKEILPERSHQRMSRDEAKMQILRLKNGVRGLVLESIGPENRKEISGFLDDCFDAGDEFAHRARDFDADLCSDGIFQALRNLWIINSIQAGFGMPVRVNSSALAYSLLYTYTDNFLDDNTVPRAEKEEFGIAFGRRLAGLDVGSDTDFFARVSQLVKLVEEEYPRAMYPGVYASLLAIHRAQQDSLRQRAEADPDILSLSVRKGGSSVLADGYLVKGTLSSLEQEFCFGYGVFLQLIDDLQDVEEDIAQGSQTFFTRAADEGALDSITMQLTAYVHRILRSVSSAAGTRIGGLTDLILQGSNGLILESVALHPLLFSET